MIDPALGTPLVVAISVGVLLVWLLAHRFKAFVLAWPLRAFFFACRIGLAAVLIWLQASLAARFFTLGFVLPLPMIALLGAVVIEAVVALTAFERGMIGKLRGRWVLGVRIAAALWLLVALLEPLAVNSTTRKWQREVAVILDASDSMQIIDERASPGYKLEVAALFGIDAARGRPQLDRTANSLRGVFDLLMRGPNGFYEEDQLKRVRAELAELAGELDDFDLALRDLISEQLLAIGAAQRAGDAPAIELAERTIGDAVGEALGKLARAQEAAEVSFIDGLSEAQVYDIEQGSARSRSEVARRVLEYGDDDLFSEIGRNYKLRFYLAGADLVAASPKAGRRTQMAEGFGDRTDLGGALDSVLRAVPPELLAGAVVVSDGAYNSGVPIDGPLRGFALRGAPIGGVPIGGASGLGAIDAAVAGVHAPRKLVLGDPLAIDVDLEFRNLTGRGAEVVLLEGGEVIDRKRVSVQSADQRVSVSFDYLPDSIGMKEYQVEVTPDGAEQVVGNNSDSARVRVMEEEEVDSLDMLLVDTFPRWEFRYLRDLFDGRDESVRLQHVLLEPESIAGMAPLEQVAASTARAFGDSRATDLPKSAAEWSGFEVIVIGDVSPESINESQWRIIEDAVSDGALLVLIAGKNFMPHGSTNPDLLALAPARYTHGTASLSPSEAQPYELRWTPAGLGSQLHMVSAKAETNEAFWAALPLFRWRHPVAEIKPGAEVLAYAEPVIAGAAPDDPDLLSKRNALIVTQRYGRGRVVAMNFDRTYRMRFGFGERFHHRFWWQLIHWRGGEEFDLDSLVELKIDRETYPFGTPVQVVAKALDRQDEPLPGPLSVKVVAADGAEVLRQTLVPRVDGYGVFEATLHDVAGAGDYEIVLEGDGVAELLSEGEEGSVAAKFKIEPEKPVELRDLSARPGVLAQLAQRTGGKVASLGDAASLVELFGDSHLSETTRIERFLWDQPLFLLVFVILLAAEWILRRQAGLP